MLRVTFIGNHKRDTDTEHMVSNPVSVRYTIYDSVQYPLVTTTTLMEIESVVYYN